MDRARRPAGHTLLPQKLPLFYECCHIFGVFRYRPPGIRIRSFAWERIYHPIWTARSANSDRQRQQIFAVICLKTGPTSPRAGDAAPSCQLRAAARAGSRAPPRQQGRPTTAERSEGKRSRADDAIAACVSVIPDGHDPVIAEHSFSYDCFSSSSDREKTRVQAYFCDSYRSLPRPRIGQTISARPSRVPIISSCRWTVVSE